MNWIWLTKPSKIFEKLRENIMAKSNTTIHYRRADNGQYTDKNYAEKHPTTTVKETDKNTTKKPKKGQK